MISFHTVILSVAKNLIYSEILRHFVPQDDAEGE